MLKSIRIRNFKSLSELQFEPSQMNVIIGENGAGKSNLLEALVCFASAFENKMDNALLGLKGVRVTEANLMTSLFEKEEDKELGCKISFDFGFENEEEVLNDHFLIEPMEKDYLKWVPTEKANRLNTIETEYVSLSEQMTTLYAEQTRLYQESIHTLKSIQDIQSISKEQSQTEELQTLFSKTTSFSKKIDIVEKDIKLLDKRLDDVKQNLEKTISEYEAIEETHAQFSNFLIYSPEESALRDVQRNAQIEPLGAKGDGLLKLLKIMQKQEKTEQIKDIVDLMNLFGWFEKFDIPKDETISNHSLTVFDQYITNPLDHRSVNEGFLFVLFYATAVVSDKTPSAFAIDNIDASLNPKLCRELIKQLTILAKKYNKQIFCTTHNPAILDGLDLNDDAQGLFVLSRGLDGETKIKRIKQKEGKANNTRLSEAFMRGYLGGLPKGF